MADNLQLPVMAGGEVIKADDMTTYKIEGVKLVVGADGVDGGYVSDANPLPVESTSTVIGSVLPAGAATEDSLLDILAALAGTLTVSGTVAVSNFPSNFAVNNFPTGFLAAQSGAWTVAVSNFPATQPVSDAGGSLTVDGTVAATQSGTWNVGTVASITNPVAVTGTFYQATQPVSIAAAVTIQDGGNVITVDGTVAATQSGAWNVGTVTSITNPVAVTGTFYQATQPVSLASVPTHAVTQSGTWNVGTVTTVTTVSAVTAITNALPAGDNNIGNVDVVTLPALPAGTNNIGDVDVLTQPARARTTDAIAAALQTDALMNGLTALTPKFANIACAASGDNQIVAAVTSKKIRIIGLFLSASGTVNAYFRDDAGSPVNLIGDGTNKITLSAASGFVLPPSPYGWQETTSGEGLQLNLSSAVGVAGSLIYVEV
jgi:hypothetical protein